MPAGAGHELIERAVERGDRLVRQDIGIEQGAIDRFLEPAGHARNRDLRTKAHEHTATDRVGVGGMDAVVGAQLTRHQGRDTRIVADWRYVPTDAPGNRGADRV